MARAVGAARQSRAVVHVRYGRSVLSGAVGAALGVAASVAIMMGILRTGSAAADFITARHVALLIVTTAWAW
jgi:hypothetical protein